MKVNWEKEKEHLKKLIEEKIPYTTIGKEYGVSGNAVKKAAKKMGIKIIQRRKVNHKEHFNKKNVNNSNAKKIPQQNMESYVLKEGEEVSVIKYKNYRGKRVLRKCEHCGCVFETLALKVRAKGGKFCSKDCHIKHMKENSMSSVERKIRERIYQKKSKYKLSEEEYKSLFLKQNNRCKICGYEFNESNKGFVDHCHITNKVRGLLCIKCNTLLGMVNDNIDILKNAIEYLKG